jgi:predicted nucleic acid-binding protein
VLVTDASLVVDYLLDDGPRGVWSAERIASATSLHAPHLLDFEVASAARNGVLRGDVSAARARNAIADLADLNVRRYPSTRLLERIWGLRETLTRYDAAYVALAEASTCRWRQPIAGLLALAAIVPRSSRTRIRTRCALPS